MKVYMRAVSIPAEAVVSRKKINPGGRVVPAQN